MKLQVKNPSKTTYELYNLEKDMGEAKNLLPRKKKVFKQLSGYIEEAHTENPLFPFN